jgi:hypothetical protein
MSAALAPLDLAPLLGAYVKIGPDRLGADSKTYEGTLTAVEFATPDGLLVFLVVPTGQGTPTRTQSVLIRRASQIRHVYRKATS